ncbi:MAG: FISUMP domain-containing protein [Crocinitomicaceae bacterium]|nr:FISUMP domain-containing protein [Crocinitomicaceae bacterium]
MKKILLSLSLLCFLNLNAQTFNCGDMLIDTRDGNTYQTILVGSQCWMAENLNLGNMIAHNTHQTNNGQYEKYCIGDSLSNCDTYGGLYQWNETMQYSSSSSQGICPSGWHVPSYSEWKNLEMELGMTQAQADLDGFRGTDQATQLVLGGTSGFNVLYAGAFSGLHLTLSAPGDHNLICSSTIAANGKQQKRGFYDFEGRVFRGSGSCPCAYDYGYSVRCI